MKNSEEMVNSLLERRDRYAAEQKNKRAIITRTVTSMCCVCLVALLGFGMWQGGMFNTTPPDQTVQDALYPGIKDNFDESKGESPDNPAANNKIVINTLNGISSGKMNINLAVDDFVKMTREEMVEYYGVNYIPDVPADIKPWKNEQSGIYRRDGGIGEVYWDRQVLNFSDEEHSKRVNLKVAKGHIPWLDYMHFGTEDETSVINNVELKIGKTDDGHYYTEFMYKNVGFTISALGLTQDEFVAVVSSLIK